MTVPQEWKETLSHVTTP